MKEPKYFPDKLLSDELLDKPLPSNIEAEKVLLGAILLDNKVFDEVAERLTPDDFYLAFHVSIFRAMRYLVETHRPIDPVLIAEELKKLHSTETSSLLQITNLTFGLPSYLNIEEYINLVEDKAKARSILRACTSITNFALAEDSVCNELIEFAETSIYSIANDTLDSGFVSAVEIVNDSKKLALERSKLGDVVTGLHTGFIDLDNKLQGLQRQELVVIAARPSVGKSTLGFCIAQNMSFRYDMNCAVFSVEMGKKMVADRIICSETGINSQRYRSGNLSEDEWILIDQVKEKIEGLYIDDSPYLTINSMRSKLRRLTRVLDGTLDLVMVDYLQLMSPNYTGRGVSRQQEISDISRELKILGREFDTCVIAMSQMNREAEKRANHRPNLSDLRESGAIEQDADVVAFIYREDLYIQNPAEYSNIAEIIIAKNRNGPTGTISLRFDGSTVSFSNLATEY